MIVMLGYTFLEILKYSFIRFDFQILRGHAYGCLNSFYLYIFLKFYDHCDLEGNPNAWQYPFSFYLKVKTFLLLVQIQMTSGQHEKFNDFW